MNGDILVPITLIISVFGVIYLYLSSRHRERLTMIENGVDASQLESKNKTLAQTLKIGMLLIGIAVGIMVGYLITPFSRDPETLTFYFSMIFLFGGLSLIINYLIEKRAYHKE